MTTLRVITAVTFLAVALARAAQALPDPAPLDKITVTATRLEQGVFVVPYTTHVLERGDFIDLRAVRTLTDALSETPGVMVQKTSYGQASPFIRGFTGFRTLMLIDGIRLNNAVFREGPNQYWATVDLLTVDRLEIVKGPSSALYGSDAIGGTVNATTVRPQVRDLAGTSTETTGAPSLQNSMSGSGGFFRFSSAERSQVARGQFSVAAPHLGLLAGVTRKVFDDLRGGSVTGVQPGSGYREIDADVKMLFRPLKNLEIMSAYHRVRQDDVPRTHATIFGKPFAGTVPGNDLRRDLDQSRDLAYVQATLREPAAGLAKAHVSLSWHRQGEEQDRIRLNRRREITGFVDDQYGLLLNFESRSPFGTLCYGLEFYRDEVDSYGTDFAATGEARALPRGGVADDARYDLLGIYIQDQFRFGDRLEVTGGIRYSRAAATATRVDPDLTDAAVFGPLNKRSDAITASLRLRYDVARSWNVFGGLSQGFRAPNLSDYTSFELARSGERETPAPDLTPEKYLSCEIGTRARIASLRTEVYGALFHTIVGNQITRFPTGRLIAVEREVTKANIGDGYTRGIEMGALVQLGGGFSFFGNFSYVDGKVDTYLGNDLVREPTSRMQPATVHMGPRWHSKNARIWFEGSATFVRHQGRLSSGDSADTQRIPPGGTPGYSVYGMHGGWRMNRHVTLTAAVENLLNEDYRTHGSGINEPGINVVTSVQVAF